MLQKLSKLTIGFGLFLGPKIWSDSDFWIPIWIRISIPSLYLDGHCPVSLPDFVPGSQLYAFMRSILHKCDVYEFYGGNKHRKVYIMPLFATTFRYQT